MLEFDSSKGTVYLSQKGLDHGVLQFCFDGLTVASDTLSWSQEDEHFAATWNGLELMVDMAGGNFRVGCANHTARPVHLAEVQLQLGQAADSSPLRAGEWMEFIHSQNFVGACGGKKVGLPTAQMPANPESSMIYMLRCMKSGRSLLFGTLPPHAGDYVVFRARHDQPHMEGTFGLSVCFTQQRQILPGQKIVTSALGCWTGEEPCTLLADYGRRWRAVRPSACSPHQGWNSWDFYAGAVQESDVLANSRAATDLLKTLAPVDCVIDEGWEARWGEWYANDKFPSGLDGLCARITDSGARPGVWTAPLVVNIYTRLYRDHPEWFGRDAQGQVVQDLFPYGPMAFLDVTHPDARAHLYGVFERLRRAGFSYFKVDFTQEVLRCERFHDPAIPRGGVIRMAFETIRDAIGRDAYLLSCGAPYESVTGLSDATRITGDIHNYWSHILMNARSIAARWWMHGQFWNNDPDFLVVRCAETCPGVRLNRQHQFKPMDYGSPWMSGREMNLREARVYALLVLLSGGELMLGDDLPSLNDAGRNLIRTVLENRIDQAAVPYDLMDRHGELPRVWRVHGEKFSMLGLFNWSENAQPMAVNLAELGLARHSAAHSLWDDNPFEVCDGRVATLLPPRSCLGLRFDSSQS